MQKLICIPLACQIYEQRGAFSAYSEILNVEIRTIIKGDMAKNVSEGEIQAVDHWICVPLPLKLWAVLNVVLVSVSVVSGHVWIIVLMQLIAF